MENEITKPPGQMSTIGQMSDRELVNYVGKRFTGFLIELRPYLIEVHTRFITKKMTRHPLLGYTDFDKFCLDFFNYSSRHVRRIISGEALPKPPKKKRLTAAVSQMDLPAATVWTDHDYIIKGTQAIKQLLKPLESDSPRYAKVAAAIAEEIVGDLAERPKTA
jgi:hypothetical protein